MRSENVSSLAFFFKQYICETRQATRPHQKPKTGPGKDKIIFLDNDFAKGLLKDVTDFLKFEWQLLLLDGLKLREF